MKGHYKRWPDQSCIPCDSAQICGHEHLHGNLRNTGASKGGEKKKETRPL